MKMKILLAAGMVLMMTAIINPAAGFDTARLQDLTYSFDSDYHLLANRKAAPA